MFFIGGTKGETSDYDSGTFNCPTCNTETDYIHKQVHQAATVFFISVANLKLLGEYIECQECFDTYEMDVLSGGDKYESYVHLAVKRIMTMIMLIDGKIDEEEKNTIKEFMEAITGDTLSDDELDEEIQFCKDNPDNPEDFLKTMFPYMNKEGGELVYKCCYHVALSDGELDSSEEKLLKRVAEILQLSSAHVKGIMAEINEN